jgi:hypothetical protein
MMEKVNLFKNEIKDVRTTVMDDETWYLLNDIYRELNVNIEHTIDNDFILITDAYSLLPDDTKGFILYNTFNREFILNTKGVYLLLLILNQKNNNNNKVNKIIKMIADEIPDIVRDNSFTDNKKIIDNFFKTNSHDYKNRLSAKSYPYGEHFKATKIILIEGIKFDCYKGETGNILIPKEQIRKSLNIISDGGFSKIEHKYFKELYSSYYIKVNNVYIEAPFKDYLSIFLKPEGLRKIIEIIKEDPEIISELDL